MRVLITGGTGFIGAALISRLADEGYDISVVTRSVDTVDARLGVAVTGIDRFDKAALAEAVGTADAVVNLAGESIIGARWTAAKKERLRSSRIDLTTELVEAMEHASNRPKVFVSASAVGFYGDAGDVVCTEATDAGDDFLARLCVDWEAAAHPARNLGVRVVTPRIGIVLGASGGALKKMLPAFRLGLGGVVGSGDQYFSWIHIDDLVGLIAMAIHDSRFQGAFNATAPNPVTNREFTRALGTVLKRPTVIPVPSFALKVMFGESSFALLAGQRAVPQLASQWGYSFAFETPDHALRDVLNGAEPASLSATQ